jgi:hypothetical protein
MGPPELLGEIVLLVDHFCLEVVSPYGFFEIRVLRNVRDRLQQLVADLVSAGAAEGKNPSKGKNYLGSRFVVVANFIQSGFEHYLARLIVTIGLIPSIRSRCKVFHRSTSAHRLTSDLTQGLCTLRKEAAAIRAAGLSPIIATVTQMPAARLKLLRSGGLEYKTVLTNGYAVVFA